MTTAHRPGWAIVNTLCLGATAALLLAVNAPRNDVGVQDSAPGS